MLSYGVTSNPSYKIIHTQVYMRIFPNKGQTIMPIKFILAAVAVIGVIVILNVARNALKKIDQEEKIQKDFTEKKIFDADFKEVPPKK
jgi:hypothetical protein